MTTAVQPEPVERLIRHITAFNPRSRHTIYQYRRVASDFLTRAASPPTQDDILDYIANKDSQAYKQFCFIIVKRLFECNRWEWPFRPGSMPQVREQYRPQVHPHDIQAMVKAVRDEGNEEGCYYLALSTTYGFRRAELCNTTRENFPGDGTIRVRTVHGGLERTHTIPDSVAPFLVNPPGDSISPDKLRTLLINMALGAGVHLNKGTGWHAIRRSLISHLSLNVPAVVLVRFMGWKRPGEHRILYTYAHPPEEEVDKRVFAEHPFLGFWEKTR